jgi:hypothetical protein
MPARSLAPHRANGAGEPVEKQNKNQNRRQGNYSMIKCPHCGQLIPDERSRKGGKAGVGKAKARTSEQARAAQNVRWDAYYKRLGIPRPVNRKVKK